MEIRKRNTPRLVGAILYRTGFYADTFNEGIYPNLFSSDALTWDPMRYGNHIYQPGNVLELTTDAYSV